jgi:hypothetical protein
MQFSMIMEAQVSIFPTQPHPAAASAREHSEAKIQARI